MNHKNALGFIVLGLALYATPTFFQEYSCTDASVQELSVRMIWLSFMGWVTGGIGFIYLSREAAVRLPSAWAMVKAEGWYRWAFSRVSEDRIPEVARVVVPN